MFRFNFRRQNFRICSLIILAVLLSKFVESTLAVIPTREIFLFKCSDSNVTEEFLVVPQKLRVLYSEGKLANFEKKYGEDRLFNFPLEQTWGSKEKSSCLSSENSNLTFTLEIPKVIDEDSYTEFEISPHGFLIRYNEDATQEIYYHRNNFCIERISKDFLHIRVCKSQCYFDDGEKTDDIPCRFKCCPLGMVMTLNGSRTGCQETIGDDWTLSSLNSDQDDDADENDEDNSSSHEKIYPNFQYKEQFRCERHEKVSSRIIRGCLAPFRESPKLCTDGFWNYTQGLVYNPEDLNLKSMHYMKICRSSSNSNVTQTPKSDENRQHGKVDKNEINFHANVLFSVAFVAMVIHLVTTLVYASLGTEQNVHALTVLAFSVSQFLLNLALCACSGIVLFIGPIAGFHVSSSKTCSRKLHPNSLCLAMGILHQFLLISSFSWSTTLTFDAWSKIRSMKPTMTMNSKGRKRFLKYCGFGFGFPLIYVSASVFMEFGIGHNRGWKNSLIRPGFSKTCVILDGWNYFIYITIPIVALFVLNMAMALLTLKVLLDARKNMKSFKDSNHTSSNFKNKASLILKLFILMGAFLFFEVLLAFYSPIKISRYFITMDFYRIANAVGLFWIFIVNKKIHSQLVERYPTIQRYVSLHTSRITTLTNISSKEFSSKSNA